MSPKKVEKTWGNADFSAEKFKAATPSEKAKMAYSLMQSKKYIGKSVVISEKSWAILMVTIFLIFILRILLQIHKKKGMMSGKLFFL